MLKPASKGDCGFVWSFLFVCVVRQKLKNIERDWAESICVFHPSPMLISFLVACFILSAHSAFLKKESMVLRDTFVQKMRANPGQMHEVTFKINSRLMFWISLHRLYSPLNKKIWTSWKKKSLKEVSNIRLPKNIRLCTIFIRHSWKPKLPAVDDF